MIKKTISFLIFNAISFWPVIFYLWIGSSLFIRNYQIQKYLPLESQTPIISYIPEALIFFLLPILAILVCYAFFVKGNTWKGRFISIYSIWVLVFFLMGFILFAALGGVSMAVVEGVAGPVSVRYLQYGLYALIFTLLAHVLILPWTYLTTLILKAINSRYSIWQLSSDTMTQ
jgi:hypothetical protein